VGKQSLGGTYRARIELEYRANDPDDAAHRITQTLIPFLRASAGLVDWAWVDTKGWPLPTRVGPAALCGGSIGGAAM
jgi:hypothetical protein